MRVLHCPTSVGGNSWTLSRAERSLGIKSDVMVFNLDWLNYSADINLQLEKSSRPGKILKLLSFFSRAITHYDIFHFNFGSSVLPYSSTFSFIDLIDLPLLKSLGKKIVVTYQGCDIRQKSFSQNKFNISACSEQNCDSSFCNDRTDSLKKRRATKFTRYADKIFALNPDLLYLLPACAEFLPYACTDLNEWQPVESNNDKITLLHSPTNRNVKGTKYIIEAVNKLKIYYRDIELILVENTSHNKVREIYSKADIAIDQLLVGWYGGFSVEMMALAKPVICYIREEDLKFIPNEMKNDLPIINANPENIFAVLKQTLDAREKLNSNGLRCRAYVEKWHNPVKIAEKLKAVYETI